MSTNTAVYERAHFSIDGKADSGKVVFTRRDGVVQIELTGEREAYGLFFANYVQQVSTKEYWFLASRFPAAGTPVCLIYIRLDSAI